MYDYLLVSRLMQNLQKSSSSGGWVGGVPWGHVASRCLCWLCGLIRKKRLINGVGHYAVGRQNERYD